MIQTPEPELGIGQELLGARQGFKANAIMRDDYLRRGGGKAKAIELISLLEARGGRSTIELCRELEVPHRKLSSIVDMARKFARAHENASITAARDLENGRLWFYWFIFDPYGLIGQMITSLQRSMGFFGTGLKGLDVIQAYSLDGKQAEAVAVLGEFFRVASAGGDEVMRRLKPLLPERIVTQARLNAIPPSHEELGVPSEGGVVTATARENLWDAARRRANA